MAKKDYYEVLELSKNASKQEIKKAFRQLAKKYHPDLKSATSSEKKFKEINEAYEVLSDDDKRKAYDMFGHNAGADKSTFNKNNFGGGFGQGFQQQYNSQGGFNFEDIINSFGGGFEDFFNPFGGQSKSSFGEDLFGSRRESQKIYVTKINIFDAYKGITVNVKAEIDKKCLACHGSGSTDSYAVKKCTTCNGIGAVRKNIAGFISAKIPCPRCNGSGKIIANPCRQCKGKGSNRTNEMIKVKIPPGIQTGQIIQLPLKLTNITTSVLNLKIIIEAHPVFKINGYDVVISVPIHFVDAILGCDIKIPTLDGFKTITLPKNIKNMQKYRIRNIHGMPHLRQEGIFSNLNIKKFGNFFIETNIIYPDSNSLSRTELNYFAKLKTISKNKAYEDYLAKIKNIYKN